MTLAFFKPLSFLHLRDRDTSLGNLTPEEIFKMSRKRYTYHRGC